MTYTNSQDAFVAIISGLAAYTDGTSSAGNVTVVYNKTLTEIIETMGLPDEAVIISFDNSVFENYEETDDRRTTENYTIFMKTLNADPVTKIYAIIDQLQSNSRFNQTNLGGGLKKIVVEGIGQIVETSKTKYMAINAYVK